ncbi:MAG: TlpA family protein disulfide reductase, partial [Saprospiraceae bacterium]|nr:TlpA family protein disulfide reductase [Saprospiraceae bacterium]
MCISLQGCFDFGNNTYSKLPPGPWRGVLKLDPERSRLVSAPHETKASENIAFDEVTEGDLPFNFDVIYDDEENFHLEIHNAQETIVLDQITFLKDRATNKDTLIIDFPPYDSYF